jgi:hypothetical protein
VCLQPPWLDVDVRGASVDGVGDDALGQADDGGVLRDGRQGQLRGVVVAVGLHRVDQLAGALVEAVGPAQRRFNQCGRGDQCAHPARA